MATIFSWGLTRPIRCAIAIPLTLNCSLFFSEGEDKIRNFIKENSNWTFEKFVKENKDIEKEWIDKSGFLRLRPDHLYNEGGMDGFFAALLKKIN